MSEWKKGDPERRSESGDIKTNGFIVRYELLSIIALMVVHLVGSIIWATTLAQDVKYMRQDLNRLTLVIDGNNTTIAIKLDEHNKQLANHENRLVRIETQKGI
jgi:E3 ubiquitin-protein ligase DOA10